MLKLGMGNKGKFGPLRIAAGFGGILCAAGQSEGPERRPPPTRTIDLGQCYQGRLGRWSPAAARGKG